MQIFHPALCATLVALHFLATPATADDLPPGMTAAGLRSGWQTATGSHMSALHVQLAGGWKTYWRAPGEAGVPPQFDWAGSDNVASVAVHWPRPQVFETNGMRTVGYRHEMILPLEITPADPTRPVRLSASVEMGICNHICVPVLLDLAAEITGPGAPDPIIAAALKARPEPHPGAARCTLAPIADGMHVRAEIDLPPMGVGEVALIELRGRPVWVSDPVTHRRGGRLISEADMVPDSASPFAVNPDDLVITILGEGGQAIEISGCPG